MTRKKKKKILISLLIITIFVSMLAIVWVNVEISQINSIPSETYISFDDLERINQEKLYGDFIQVDMDKAKLEVGENSPQKGKVIFKLFGFIPIKTVDVQIIKDERVYLGGNAVGFSIKTDGVIVVGKNSILTENGFVNVCEHADLRAGDTITHVNGIGVKDANDIPALINKDGVSAVEMSVKRGDNQFVIELTPVEDVQSKKKKIGLWVRDDATGIGTLTYVNDDDMKFGALGHPVTDGETGVKIDIQEGKVFSCSIVGLEKGEKGNPGEIKGVFLDGKNSKGDIKSGNEFGIFGNITDKNGIIDENVYAGVAGRLAVRPGKAQIVSSVSGVREYYDIEIIKANKQNSAKDRSLVFRVKDKRLLNLTGGIIQGMSGSPILQNGKLIGAVTHVFVSDPTKGYGIYIDWMMI